ncbi:SpoIIE family protein phosphatase [Streptomyces sp. NPDC052225]|uniref:SpoIIE family protein phosphatase n=1 Tax=Streptomyces sp. NPDC052225 TaxID=3154949 RepID=UPI003424A89C
MGSIPVQRETAAFAADLPDHSHEGHAGPVEARTSLPGNQLAPAAARRFVRATLDGWAEAEPPGAEGAVDRLADDAVVIVSELVTNAVVHAGTSVDVLCHLTGAALVIEVTDHHPARALRGEHPGRAPDMPEYGRGLRLVASLSESWGITYRTGTKTVWARLPAAGTELPAAEADPQSTTRALQRGLHATEFLAPPPRRAPDRDWVNRGALSFLAEASDMLAGQLDVDMVAALVGQLLVPRLADWCAVWFYDEEGRGMPGPVEPDTRGTGAMPPPRLARVWHSHEGRIEELRRLLEKEPPRLPDSPHSAPVAVPWPFATQGETGAALAYRLSAGGRALGILLIGRAGLPHFPDEVTGLVEDFSRRVALAVSAARRFTRQATISRILQRGLLPSAIAEIPGMKSALVYEPREAGGPGGDFYDVFPASDGRWCFALGDVQGKGPEAAVVIGLARPWLRLLAREGYPVAQVLDRLNRLLLDDATEAADSAARALAAAAGGQGVPPEGSSARFLSLLYGELTPTESGVTCTLASAGHPLPLLMRPGGEVVPAAGPQMLLGVVDDPDYTSETFEMLTGDTLLCVTDGVTERRRGHLQFDDADGLAHALAGCAGLTAPLVAERIRRLVHAFADSPPDDDLALLVLQAQ